MAGFSYAYIEKEPFVSHIDGSIWLGNEPVVPALFKEPYSYTAPAWQAPNFSAPLLPPLPPSAAEAQAVPQRVAYVPPLAIAQPNTPAPIVAAKEPLYSAPPSLPSVSPAYTYTPYNAPAPLKDNSLLYGGVGALGVLVLLSAGWAAGLFD